MLNIAVVDDEPIFIDTLINTVANCCNSLGIEYADEIDNSGSGYIADDRVRLTDNTLYGGSTGMESSYDPRIKNLSTDIKDQGNTQLCWMYSTVATEEQFAMKKFGKKLNISEIHGAAAISDFVINQDYQSYLLNLYLTVQPLLFISLQKLVSTEIPHHHILVPLRSTIMRAYIILIKMGQKIFLLLYKKR